MDQTRGNVWQQIAVEAKGHPNRASLDFIARRVDNMGYSQAESDMAKKELAEIAQQYRLGELAVIANSLLAPDDQMPAGSE